MHPLEARIGYKFRNPLLLAEALTHSSLHHEGQPGGHFDNQRLEYLGDAVLQLLVAEELFRRFPDADEGRLTQSRARLVSGDALALYGQRLQLGQHLLLGRGDESSGGRRRPGTLSDAFEALVGAVYLDGGLDAARTFLLAQMQGDLASFEREQPPPIANPKGDLQEILQALPRPADAPADAPRNPTYRIVSQAGPDHARLFTARVDWSGLRLGTGTGASKQLAESAAAVDALRARRWEAAPGTAEDGSAKPEP